MSTEACIFMNGRALSDAQAMTVRVALESFASDLKNDGLGKDEHGKVMTSLYMRRIDEIRDLMYGLGWNTKPKDQNENDHA